MGTILYYRLKMIGYGPNNKIRSNMGMSKKLKVWMLSLLLTVVMVLSSGCTLGGSGTSNLQDATAVQLETSLISGMNSILSYTIYKAFGIYNQVAQTGGL